MAGKTLIDVHRRTKQPGRLIGQFGPVYFIDISSVDSMNASMKVRSRMEMVFCGNIKGVANFSATP